MRINIQRRPALTLLSFAVAGCAVAASQFGPIHASASEILEALWTNHGTANAEAIVQIRLPRVVLALLVGAVLAVSGTAMQALFRNPLAEPGLVGLSSGAALGAAIMIVLGHGWSWLDKFPSALILPIAAFSGASLATWVVVRLALVDGQARVATLLLAGLAINAICGAGIGLLSVIASDGALRTLTFWLFGSLGKVGWDALSYTCLPILAPLVMLPFAASRLNALLLGEAEAQHLGVNVARLKMQLLVLITLGVGAAVSVAGIISFVGLIVPHLLRMVTGPDHRTLLPASALGGALLLLIADTAARSLLQPSEIPIGVVTALVGGPFFLLLLIRHRDQVDFG